MTNIQLQQLLRMQQIVIVFLCCCLSMGSWYVYLSLITLHHTETRPAATTHYNTLQQTLLQHTATRPKLINMSDVVQHCNSDNATEDAISNALQRLRGLEHRRQRLRRQRLRGLEHRQ